MADHDDPLARPFGITPIGTTKVQAEEILRSLAGGNFPKVGDQIEFTNKGWMFTPVVKPTADRTIIKSASAAFSETLNRLTSPHAPIIRYLTSGLSAAAASSLSLSRTITKSASAVFGDSLAVMSIPR